MKRIKLKGELHPELLAHRLKAGDEVNADIQKSGAAYFTLRNYAVPQECVVYPENYEKINV